MILLAFTIAFGGSGLILARAERPDRAWTAITSLTASPAPVSSSDLLTSASDLRESLAADTGTLRVIDLSSERDYDSAHVPGAIHAWWQDGMDPYAAAYGEVLRVQVGDMNRTSWFQSLGIGPASTVVVYDDDQGRNAARFVWMLNYMGLTKASMLGGGLAAWTAAGYETTSHPGSIPQVDTLPGPVQQAWLIGSKELAATPKDSRIAIVDVRTDAEARDDLNGTIRVGQIPGSKSIPWTDLVTGENGQLKTVPELKALFATLDVPPDGEIVLYGRFGIDTGLTWLALREAGYSNIRIYDEGWATWGKDTALPVQTRVASGK
jgi:thiosulfate/3-mercaptopyruvate sulfurtransferase